MINSSLLLVSQGLSVAAPDASAIEESNALALAIVPSGNQDILLSPFSFCILCSIKKLLIRYISIQVLLHHLTLALYKQKISIRPDGSLPWSPHLAATCLLLMSGNW